MPLFWLLLLYFQLLFIFCALYLSFSIKILQSRFTKIWFPLALLIPGPCPLSRKCVGRSHQSATLSVFTLNLSVCFAQHIDKHTYLIPTSYNISEYIFVQKVYRSISSKRNLVSPLSNFALLITMITQIIWLFSNFVFLLMKQFNTMIHTINGSYDHVNAYFPILSSYCRGLFTFQTICLSKIDVQSVQIS